LLTGIHLPAREGHEIESKTMTATLQLMTLVRMASSGRGVRGRRIQYKNLNWAEQELVHVLNEPPARRVIVSKSLPAPQACVLCIAESLRPLFS
jgi:hypothetical protein